MRVIVSWSTGKDSAWMLHQLRQEGVDVIGLLSTVSEEFDRVSMHGVRRSLLDKQAAAVGLPLNLVKLPWPCSNAEYETRMAAAVSEMVSQGVTHVAFGDLFLEDVRAYREDRLSGSGLKPLFPIWHPKGGTSKLAAEMIESGLEAVLTCVDPEQLDPSFLGRKFDTEFLAELSDKVDPCGENGEFHTFCSDGPMFEHPIYVEAGERVVREGFHYVDLVG